MFEHFDDGARTCVVFAQEEARRLGHDELGTVHLLLGVARVDGWLLGVEVETVRATVVALQGSGATPTVDAIPFSAEATTTLKAANAQALSLGHTTIGLAHVLLALMETGGGGARALREAGAIPSEVRERALAVAGTPRPAARTTRRRTPAGPPTPIPDRRRIRRRPSAGTPRASATRG